MRRELAQAAARIMAEQGISDFLMAKQKAAERLGVSENGNLPRNTEVQAALKDYHRLFGAGRQDVVITRLRREARNAMALFEGFSPRLVGQVLAGTASDHAAVELHVFADTPEQVAFHLMHNEVPFESGEWRGRSCNGEAIVCAAYTFLAGDVPVEAVVFPVNGLREAPSSPVDGQPMPRATLRELDAMIATGAVELS
ncbi:MAG: hypothetical protein HKN59_07160 [Gammaproteobacteria bacterium]|nr:hypothetical protein [Gammaproteobacteria bacterium]